MSRASRGVAAPAFVARLRRGDGLAESAARAPLLRGGAHAITGGLGGLGLRAAAMLAHRGASSVVLTSRSGRVVRGGQGLEAQLAGLRMSAVRVVALACDVGSRREALAMARAAQAAAPCQPLRSVLHAAGLADKGLVREILSDRIRLLSTPSSRRSRATKAGAVTPREALLIPAGVSLAKQLARRGGQRHLVAHIGRRQAQRRELELQHARKAPRTVAR